MNTLNIVTGAGPVGWTVATQLAERGEQVRILTRSGSGPDHPLIERRKVDVSQADQLAAAMDGATAVFHCIHGSAYSAKVWQKELPAAEAIVLAAAQQAGAVVVFPESMYSYSAPNTPMTEAGPRQATGGKRGIRTALLAARAAANADTVSVVASDFFGPRVRVAHAGDRMVPRILTNQKLSVIANQDVPHSFTYVPDFAAAMIAASGKPELWNTVLHAPTGPALTQRAIAKAFADAAGLPLPKVSAIPGWVVRALGVFSPSTRELAETLYQFEQPFILDSAQSQKLLGLAPTPLDVAAKATVEWWRGELASA